MKQNNTEDKREEYIRLHVKSNVVDEIIALRRQYDQGEITKDEYERLRESLLELGYQKVVTGSL